MCGPEEIQLQVFTRNLRPHNEHQPVCIRMLARVDGAL
jgi:hypothetical protein